MKFEDYQFGSYNNEAFPKERPNVDQIYYGKPLEADEVKDQQRAIDDYNARKRGQGAVGHKRNSWLNRRDK